MNSDLLQSRLSSIESKNPKVLSYLERRKELGVDEQRCSYYIKRKKRCCSNRAVSACEGSVCSMHTPDALEAARLQDEESRRLFDQRRANSAADMTGDSADSGKDGAGSEKCEGSVETPAPSNPDAATAARKRIRVSAPKRMINPFGAEVSPEVSTTQLEQLLSRFAAVDSRSMHIDVGCARGKCIAGLARRYTGWNHLGVEIRNDLCLTAVDEYVGLETDNLYFLGCNFVQSAGAILSALPTSIHKLVSFQFPDPWRRSKHLRRLIIQPELLALLRLHLCSDPGPIAGAGGDAGPTSASAGAGSLDRKNNYIYCSSDCEDVARHMREQFTTAGFSLLASAEEYAECVRMGIFVHPSGSTSSETTGTTRESTDLTPEFWKTVATEDHWLRFNPLGEPSERELVCEVDWRRVWRCVYVCR